ncbi:AEL327Wp [Corynebacterium xerosis]|nr:AEL327Wp [Corynebacterium xerosis]
MMDAMRSLRTAGIILAVALAAIGLAVVPSIEEAPSARPGIVVGEQAGASDGGGDVDGDGAVLPGDVPESLDASGAVTLPRSDDADGSAGGTHPDGDPGAMEYEPSPQPTAAPDRSAGSSGADESRGSSSSTSGADGSSSRTAPAAPTKPAAPAPPAETCEWDDDGWECDEDEADEDEADEDEDDEDDD